MINPKKLLKENPSCPKCGNACNRDARKEQWICENNKQCNYSVTFSAWETIMTHASVINDLLEQLNIEYILYHGVPIEREIAVLPSHLLPLFILLTEQLGESAQIDCASMLTFNEISDEAAQTPMALLHLNVEMKYVECPIHESLTAITAAVNRSVAICRANEPKSTMLDSKYIFEAESTLEIA